jgi:hypothetical protein
LHPNQQHAAALPATIGGLKGYTMQATITTDTYNLIKLRDISRAIDSLCVILDKACTDVEMTTPFMLETSEMLDDIAANYSRLLDDIEHPLRLKR